MPGPLIVLIKLSAENERGGFELLTIILKTK